MFDKHTIGIAMLLILSTLALQYLHQQTHHILGSHFNNTTLIVVAHPDDESMFLGPTVLSLALQRRNLVILCLSNGNSDGLGSVRETEMKHATEALGETVTLKLVDDDRLADRIDQVWKTEVVAGYIEREISNHNGSIDTVISFDREGVSGHANHISISHALQHILLKSEQEKISVYALKSVIIWRKYASFFDSMITVAQDMLNFSNEIRLTLSLDFRGYQTLRSILLKHQSQMVWYRKLYMMFSRYMFFNDLVLLTI